MAKCRFNHNQKVLVWVNGKQEEIERPAQGRHMHEKICDNCRAEGRTKEDALKLLAKR